MAGSHAHLDILPISPPDAHETGGLRSRSMTERMVERLMPGKRPPVPDAGQQRQILPRPVQLALPLRNGADAQGEEEAFPATPLFREARRIEPVLSYEQARLEQIVPGAEPAQDRNHDRLVLPGGAALVLYEGNVGAMAFDWMRWGRKHGESSHMADTEHPGATIGLAELRKGGRLARRLMKRRCIIPLTRYSIPVREDRTWSHRWIAPAQDTVLCAAGVWDAEGGSSNIFTMVTDTDEADAGGPLLLSESDLLRWLRAPLAEALTIIAGSRLQAPARQQ